MPSRPLIQGSRVVLGFALLVALSLSLPGCSPVADEATASESSPKGDAWSVDIGFLDFPTEASGKAQEHFLKGVGFLHSFGYKQAKAEFQAAQKLDPDFAMAYWGEAFCYNHPLLPERDLDSPREVLARLGATPEERAAKAPSQREKDFLAAAETLFGEGPSADRRIAYMEAMKEMHETYPDDDEVTSFYALSLLAAVGPMNDDTFRLAMEAGALALGVFERNPDHPGAAHYIIHAFDDPVHAPLALPAAERFDEIAAAVSHARHMPTHIFIQRGMWDRVSVSNDSAYQAAVDLWEKGDSVADMVHAVDWGHYGDLQWGDRQKALGRREVIEQIIADSDGAERAVSTEGLMWARQVVETEEWSTREIDDETSAPVALATGISAVKAGDLALAKRAAARLEELGSKQVNDRSTFQRGTGPAKVSYHEVMALIEHAEGRSERAIEHLGKGVGVAKSMGPPRGSASPVKPVYELYGEVLLEMGRAEDAADKFEASLLYTPNRPRSLLGLARAHREAGDPAEAADAYRRLTEVWSGRDFPEVREATTYLEQLDT